MIKAFFDFGYLILAALILIGGFLWAGYATKSSAMKAWGYMFAVIMNGFGQFFSAHPIAGCLLLTAWMGFCWALTVHLFTRKQVGDNK